MPKIKRKIRRRYGVIRSSSEDSSDNNGPKIQKVNFGRYLKEKHTDNYVKQQIETLIESDLSGDENDNATTDKNKSKTKRLIITVSSEDSNCDDGFKKNILGKSHKEDNKENSKRKDGNSMINLQSLQRKTFRNQEHSQIDQQINSFIEDENDTSDHTNDDEKLLKAIVEVSSDEDEINNENDCSKIEFCEDQSISSQLIGLFENSDESNSRNLSQLITKERNFSQLTRDTIYHKKSKLRYKKDGFLKKFYSILKVCESDAMFWVHESHVISNNSNSKGIINDIQPLYGNSILTIQLSNDQIIKIFTNNDTITKMNLKIGSWAKFLLDGDKYNFDGDVIYLPINKISNFNE